MKEDLKTIYFDKIRYQSATGVDKVRPESFENKIDQEIDFITRKIKSESFNFHPYKELLISKGRDKKPRLISVPTVRDKLLLSYLNYELKKQLSIETNDVYSAIKKIISYINNDFHYFTKIDIKGFYDSIDHYQLLNKIKTRCDDKIYELIKKAIENETIKLNTKKTGHKNTIGIPQGIPISNLLANFYLKEIDDDFQKIPNIFYLRYVDDIILLSNKKNSLQQSSIKLKDHIESYNLKLNEEKKESGSISHGLDFLGYHIDHPNKKIRIMPKKSSVQKMYLSLLQTINTYKYLKHKGKTLNLERLKWDLNLKITGAVLDKKRYGWLFFFSQMNEDSEVLYKLDSFINLQLKKYFINNISPKKFVRAHKEIKKNIFNTSYIPNFDTFSDYDIESFLWKIINIPKEEIQLMAPHEKKILFRKYIFSSVKKLEKDLISIS